MNKHGETPLHIAAKTGNLTAARLLLQHQDIDLTKQTYDRKRPIDLIPASMRIQLLNLYPVLYVAGLILTNDVNYMLAVKQQDRTLFQAVSQFSTELAAQAYSIDNVNALKLLHTLGLVIFNMRLTAEIAKLSLPANNTISSLPTT